MRRKTTEVSSLVDLRRRAESSSGARFDAGGGERPVDFARLVHELEVHQAELELQNEELLATSHQLEKSRDRYFEIYDLAPVGHLTLDLGGSIVEANHAAAALAGMERSRLIGRKLSSLLSTADADALHLNRKEAILRVTAVGCEVALRKWGGDPSPVYLRSKVLRNSEGEPESFLCVLFDLSELRRAEHKLHVEQARVRESEARLREIAEHVEDALMLREQDGTFAYVSPAYERIWGRPSGELLADASIWQETIHPADRSRLLQAATQLEAGAPFEETFRILRPDLTSRWVRARFFPFEPVQGERTRYVGIAQDITFERALEDELRQAQKMEAVGSLASAIAHDFGNLLQGITGCAAIARASEDAPERQRAYLDRIVDAVRRGAGLVSQLMSFSRKENVEPRPTRVDDVIRGTATLVEQLVGEHIQVEIRPGAPAGLILADPVQIEQILMNLAANARDAMPEGGTLTIETEDTPESGPVVIAKSGRAVRLVVRDTGSGMDEQTRAHMFEPFFTTKPPGLGTGIGLSSVLAITRSLGGRVDVETELGTGTTLVFDFPIVEEPPLVAFGPDAPRRFQGRALLIEDHSLVRMTVRHYLEELGLEVMEASSPNQAIQVCEASPGPIAVCVSDVTLPGGSGPKVMRLLRQRYPDLRSLFITAHPTAELVARGILDQAAAALQKPFGKAELAAKLAALLPS